jgi:four helix bundle protein
MDQGDLKRRTKEFGLRILKLCAALPETITGRAIAGQLVRSGTSVGCNYRAACRARSRAEFAAKIGIVVEEADESAFWIELIIDGGLMPADRLRPLLQEAEELVAIMVRSRKTAQRKAARKSAGGT